MTGNIWCFIQGAVQAYLYCDTCPPYIILGLHTGLPAQLKLLAAFLTQSCMPPPRAPSLQPTAIMSAAFCSSAPELRGTASKPAEGNGAELSCSHRLSNSSSTDGYLGFQCWEGMGGPPAPRCPAMWPPSSHLRVHGSGHTARQGHSRASSILKRISQAQESMAISRVERTTHEC